MTAPNVFARIIASLREAGIAHMLTGSFASAYHGSPRATQDIDFVIEADADRLELLVRLLTPDQWYVDGEAALEALRNETQFNAIDLAPGWKIDLMIRKSRPFSQEEFQRRESVDLDGTSIDVVRADDLIIAKLEWARRGGSGRQLEDVAAVLGIRGDEIDVARIVRWVESMGLEREWQEARRMVAG